jgi:hypothetical protein
MKKLIDRCAQRDANRVVWRDGAARRDHRPMNRTLRLRMTGAGSCTSAQGEHARRERVHASTGE